MEAEMGGPALGEMEAGEEFEVELKRFNNLSQLLPNVILNSHQVVTLQSLFKVTENDFR